MWTTVAPGKFRKPKDVNTKYRELQFAPRGRAEMMRAGGWSAGSSTG
ncbi:MAG: hypothetical protein IPM63_10895 [Acidobacteriota bacterium]|nr:MAG: hypothetical protein IPM63_10895 [Acidobacteriota bacterium]